ncbi:F-box/WD repeat-containing protein 9, partial [Tulasnella sp. 332]
ALTEITNELRTIKAGVDYRQIKTAVTSVLTYQAVQDRIDACSSKLNWAMGVFQIESLAQAELDRLQHHLELRKDIKELATVGTGLSPSPSSLSRLTSLSAFPAGTILVGQTLQPAPARFDARDAASGCLEGTRTRILHDIRDWIFNTNSDPLQIFWLYGLAGTGKSTIAHTISEYCAAAGNLGASFFFSRDQADRTDGRRVFSTIAFQLAYYIP